MSLPRCGHETVVSCPTAETLKQWTGESCPTIDCVQEGESYGPKDYFCKQAVKFQRLCGHHVMLRCERAFELAQSPSRCQESVVVSNPECGHDCSTTCFEEKRLLDKVLRSSGKAEDVDPLEAVHEGDPSNFRSYGFNVQCSQEVTYVRVCCHKTKMKCSETRHISTVCEELVTTKLPICGHLVRLPCHLTKYLSAWHPWQVQTPSIQLLHVWRGLKRAQGPVRRARQIVSQGRDQGAVDAATEPNDRRGPRRLRTPRSRPLCLPWIACHG